jgi:hypothetical protein
MHESRAQALSKHDMLNAHNVQRLIDEYTMKASTPSAPVD